MIDDVFGEMAVLLLLAAVVGFVATLLRQPLIIAYIVVGILVGPSLLNIATSHDEISLLAELGIALLLFIVGLKLDLQLIRSVGPVALATGLGQVIFTSFFGFLIAISLGLELTAALYVAVALTFSSTIIIVKLLSDKREIDDLHGRIAVGFLIVQDIMVVLVMIALTAFGTATGDASPVAEVTLVFAKGVGLMLVLAIFSRYLLERLLHRLAHSQELLVLFAIAWAIALAALSDTLGFSKEVGAFLGGVVIASTPYRDAISARLVSLRDFLLLFFFIDLGIGLELGGFAPQLPSAIVLSLFVLIGNPLIVIVIMGSMGYRKRVSLLAGLTVAQISEFSLILAALGLSLGHITEETVVLITTVGLITIALSTYMIINSFKLFEWLGPYLSIFERDIGDREGEFNEPANQFEPEYVVLGLGRYGGEIGRSLAADGREVLGVDFDPVALGAWESAGLAALYGDAEDPE